MRAASPPARISTRLTKAPSDAIDPDLVVTQDLCAVCAVDITEVDQALDTSDAGPRSSRSIR